MYYYTYAFLREDRTPYYIGKGKDNRAYRRRNKGEIKPPKDKSRILILKKNLTEEESFKHEVYMIAVFGRKDLGTGILHNRTDGGEGVSGALRSEEYKRKLSDFGKIGGTKTYKMKVGIHGLKPEQMSKNGKKGYESGLGKLDEKEKSNAGKGGGKRTAELKVGVHAISLEEKSKIGTKNYQMKVGIHSLTLEETIENAKKGGNKAKELGLGVHARTKEQMFEDGRKGGLIGGKTTSSQKWICLETGFITNAGNLTRYQKARGIDTTNRRRIS
jgi:hypothetical protein